jgi:hypothetical protein
MEGGEDAKEMRYANDEKTNDDCKYLLDKKKKLFK